MINVYVLDHTVDKTELILEALLKNVMNFRSQNYKKRRSMDHVSYQFKDILYRGFASSQNIRGHKFDMVYINEDLSNIPRLRPSLGTNLIASMFPERQRIIWYDEKKILHKEGN